MMGLPTHAVQDFDDIFERLLARFPPSTTPDPSSPISSAMAALERRASNKSNKSLPSTVQRSRTISPSQSRLKISLEIDSGVRSTASSPGPPRRAVPPAIRTKMRSPSELFLPTPTTAKGFRFSKLVLDEGEWHKQDKEETRPVVSLPPPVPVSPISASIALAIAKLDVHASVQSAINNLSVPDHSRFMFDVPARSSTAPPTVLRRQPSFLSIKSSRSLPLHALGARSNRPGGSSSRGAGVRPLVSPKILNSRFGGIDKDVLAEKRASALMAKRKGSHGTPTEDAEPTKQSPKKTTSVMPWRRKPRGETMSMLIDSGFFPVQEYIYNKTPPGTSAPKRGQLVVVTDDLPSARPSSILKTPAELYARAPLAHRRSLRNSRRRSQGPHRRRIEQYPTAVPISPTTVVAQYLLLPPLSPLPPSPTALLTPTKALSALNGLLPSPTSPQPSPGILEVIPEDSQASTPSPLFVPPDPAPPQQTHIQLSTGAILTMKPPELSAWRRSIYTQGPIKLPTPAVVPRKDSIASLDPFAGAVHAARRKSEDAALDDLCPWYAAWGFDSVAFAPDAFGPDVPGGDLGPVLEAPESPVDAHFRFAASTPPPLPAVRGAAESTSHGAAKPMPRAAWRAEGRGGNGSGRPGDNLLGGETWRSDSEGSVSGASDADEVKEGWWDSRGKSRRGSAEGSGLKAKPKMSRVRRFVQTASAIL